jgi:hypothetical protein
MRRSASRPIALSPCMRSLSLAPLTGECVSGCVRSLTVLLEAVAASSSMARPMTSRHRIP